MYGEATGALCYGWGEVAAGGPLGAVDVASSSPRGDWRVGDLFEDVPVADGDPPDVVPVDALGEELGALGVLDSKDALEQTEHLLFHGLKGEVEELTNKVLGNCFAEVM